MSILAAFTIAGVLMDGACIAEPGQQDLIGVSPPPFELHRQAHHRGASYVDASLIFPDRRVVEGSWPKKAAEDEVQGFADVDCLIRADGTLTRCELLAEGPMGYAFGKATVGLFNTYVRADLASLPGGWQPNTRVQYRWYWAY